MNPVNSMYGHDLVLALWTGLHRRVPPIWGFLQHAWMEDLPFWQGERHSRFWPIIVFSERNRSAAKEWCIGRCDTSVIAIGDPFLYVVRLLASLGARPSPSRGGGTIVYPMHADGRDETIARHRAYGEFVRETEGAETTVCLHWHDWGNPRLRGAYEDLGFRVISHGFNASPHFLFAQHAELLRHERVVSNVVGTALFHGGALGLHMEVMGPVFGERDTPEELEALVAHQCERWPTLVEGGVRGDAAVVLAGEELGAEHMREPEDLKELLGWTGAARVRAEALAPTVRLLRKARGRA